MCSGIGGGGGIERSCGGGDARLRRGPTEVTPLGDPYRKPRRLTPRETGDTPSTPQAIPQGDTTRDPRGHSTGNTQGPRGDPSENLPGDPRGASLVTATRRPQATPKVPHTGPHQVTTPGKTPGDLPKGLVPGSGAQVISLGNPSGKFPVDTRKVS